PLRAVLVGEGHSGSHALHVLGGVIRVTFHEIDAERPRKRGTDQALAGARDAHHDVKAFVQRTGWDSNPRYAINVHTLSRTERSRPISAKVAALRHLAEWSSRHSSTE